MPNASAARTRRSEAAAGHAEQNATDVDAPAQAASGFEDLQKLGMDWESGKGGSRNRDKVQGEGRAAAQHVTFGSEVVIGRKAVENSRAASSSRPSNPSSPSRGRGTSRVKQEIKEENVEMKSENKSNLVPKAYNDNKNFSILNALDYSQYYPTTLPMDSNQPRVKKEEEKDEEGDQRMDHDSSSHDKKSPENDCIEDIDLEGYLDNSGRSFAEEIGLVSRSQGAATSSSTVKDEERNWLLFQLPTILPIRRSIRPKSDTQPLKGEASTSKQAAEASDNNSKEGEGLRMDDLPSGEIGQVLVYKSGKIKMKIGDVMMDMAQGLPVMHRMDVAALSAQSNGFFVLGGQVVTRVQVTPDITDLIKDEHPDDV